MKIVGLAMLLGVLPADPSLPARAEELSKLADDFWAWRAVHQPVSRDDMLRLYREHYFDFNVRHFHEKLGCDHGICLSYGWVKVALQTVRRGEARSDRFAAFVAPFAEVDALNLFDDTELKVSELS